MNSYFFCLSKTCNNFCTHSTICENRFEGSKFVQMVGGGGKEETWRTRGLVPPSFSLSLSLWYIFFTQLTFKNGVDNLSCECMDFSGRFKQYCLENSSSCETNSCIWFYPLSPNKEQGLSTWSKIISTLVVRDYEFSNDLYFQSSLAFPMEIKGPRSHLNIRRIPKERWSQGNSYLYSKNMGEPLGDIFGYPKIVQWIKIRYSHLSIEMKCLYVWWRGFVPF